MGTTNLHVDIADAINIMLYVGHPSDSVEESSANAEAVLNVMRQSRVDTVYMERAMRWMRHTQVPPNSTSTNQSPTDGKPREFSVLLSNSFLDPYRVLANESRERHIF